jgi:hypothetical protein
MKKIKQWITGLQDRIDDGINRICYSMSPLARLLSVLVVGLVCGIAFLYMMIASIYNIGKRDAEKEFLRLQHIESLELQPKAKNDSMDSIKNYELKIKSKDEYEQSNR